jgi:hypothetical protein
MTDTDYWWQFLGALERWRARNRLQEFEKGVDFSQVGFLHQIPNGLLNLVSLPLK